MPRRATAASPLCARPRMWAFLLASSESYGKMPRHADSQREDRETCYFAIELSVALRLRHAAVISPAAQCRKCVTLTRVIGI